MCFVFVHRLTQTVTVDVTETVHSHPYDSTTGLMNQEFLCSLDALRGRGLGRGTRGATAVLIASQKAAQSVQWALGVPIAGTPLQGTHARGAWRSGMRRDLSEATEVVSPAPKGTAL